MIHHPASRLMRFVVLSLLFISISARGQTQEADANPSESNLETRISGPTDSNFEFPPLKSDDPKDMCVYYHKRGAAELKASRYEDSIDDLKRALSLDRGSSTPDSWCDTWAMQNELSLAYASSGDHLSRIEFLQRILPQWQGKYRREFSVWFHLNQSYRALARIKDSEDSLQTLTQKFKQISSKGRDQNNVNNLYFQAVADNQELLGNYAEAERYRHRALENAQAFAAALQSEQFKGSREALVAYRNVSNENGNLAANLVRQGKLADAYYWANQAMNPVNGIVSINSIQRSFLLNILSDISLLQGNSSKAKKYASQSIRVLQDSHLQAYAPQLALRREKLAFILETQGQWNDALQIYEERDRGLHSRPGAPGLGHIDWSMALVKTGHADQALPMLTRMLRNQEKRIATNPLLVSELHGYRGAALAQSRQLDAAQLEFSVAIPALVNHLRNNNPSGSSNSIDKFRIHLILNAYLDYLADLQRQNRTFPGAELGAEAFRIADIARSSSVQTALVSSAARATIANPQLAALAKKEQSVSSQKQSLQDVMLRLASSNSAVRLEKVIGDMRRDASKLSERQAQLRSEIAQKYPDYSQLLDPRPPVPADIQRVLGDDEVCLAIYSNETQTFVWTLTSKDASFRTVPLSKEQIAKWVAELRESVDLTQGQLHRFATGPAFRLYDALMAPDRPLWGTRHTVNLIASDALAQIPPGLLLTHASDVTTFSDYGNLPWLIKDVALAEQPSASSLWALRTLQAPAQDRRRAPFIGFGNPRFSLKAETVADANFAPGIRNLSVTHMMAPAVETDQAAGSSDARPAPPEPSRPTLAQAFARLPQLPDTSLELQEIAHALHANSNRDLLLDTRANESEVKARDLTAYRVIAFATHGLVPGEIDGLDQPALALSNPAVTGEKNNDGFLTLDEVLSLKLNADWVILSACNTASAEGTSSEALSGLGRGFFYAGARSLLVSNWSVESASARMLTTGIFEEQERNPRMSRAEALRHSMLTVLAARPEYGHPAFWAPFTLAGDGSAQ